MSMPAAEAPPITFDRPVWELTAEVAPDTSVIDSNKSAEIAVLGAGYTGLTAALALIERGRRPIVLEAKSIGFGASGRNGGQVVPGLKHDPDTLARMLPGKRGEALIAFAGATATRTFDLIRKYQLRCDATQCGWLQPARSERQLRAVTNRAAQWRRHAGVDSRVLDAAALRELTGTEIYVGGWIDPRGGQLQPLSYARELARVVLAGGASIHTGAHVTALRHEGGRWRLAVNGHDVIAEKVIVATNAYADELVPGLRRSVIVANSIQTATEPLPSPIRSSILPAGLPVSDARRLLNYFRFDSAGRFLIGARGSFGRSQPERFFAGLREAAIEMFPALREIRWEVSWGGPFALTTDHLPHIHIPAPGLYVGLGCNGRGVALASQMGPLLAELSLGTPPNELPLPVTSIAPVPLHALRRPGLEGIGLWYRLLDHAGF